MSVSKSKREDTELRYEANKSLIGSLVAGLRPVREVVLTVAANSEANFTVQTEAVRRLAIQPQVGGASGDVRLAPPNDTATATSMPMLGGTRPFMLWVGKDDVISFYNDTGGEKVVTIWECL